MSADNYWYIRKEKNKYKAYMRFASDDSLPLQLGPVHWEADSLEEAIHKAQLPDNWTEYGYEIEDIFHRTRKGRDE